MDPQKSKAQKTTIRFLGVVQEAVTDKVQAFFFVLSRTVLSDSLPCLLELAGWTQGSQAS